MQVANRLNAGFLRRGRTAATADLVQFDDKGISRYHVRDRDQFLDSIPRKCIEIIQDIERNVQPPRPDIGAMRPESMFGPMRHAARYQFGRRYSEEQAVLRQRMRNWCEHDDLDSTRMFSLCSHKE
jgi:hypothetical protein